MDNVQPSVVSVPGVVSGKNQLPAAAIANNASKTIDSGGSLAGISCSSNTVKSRKNAPVEYSAKKIPEKSLTERKVNRHEEPSRVIKSYSELMSFYCENLKHKEFSYDLAGFTPKSTEDLKMMESFREDVACFDKMVSDERQKLRKMGGDRTSARQSYECLREQLFNLKHKYFILCYQRYKPVSGMVLVLQMVSSSRLGDEPDMHQLIKRLTSKYCQCVGDLGMELYWHAVCSDRLAQHWQVFMSQSMEFLNVCADLISLHQQLSKHHQETFKGFLDSASGLCNTVSLSLIIILDDAVNHYAQLEDKDDLNRGLGSDVTGLSKWLNSASNNSDLFKCYEIPQVIQMISASLCIGEFVTARKLLSAFIKLIDGKIDGIHADLDDTEWLFYLASKAVSCLVCLKLPDIGNDELKNIETIKKLLKEVMQKAEQMFSLSAAECSELDECFQRFVEGPCRDVLLMHALRGQESARQINCLISGEESGKTREKREIRGKLKRKMARGYGYRKPVEPKAPVPAAQSTARQDSPTPQRETSLPQGVQDAVKAFIADRPMAEVTAMIQSVVDDPDSTPVVKAESYFALADMLDRKMNREFNRIISQTSFIYSYGQLIRAGVMPSSALGVAFKKAIQDATDITKICGWLNSVNDALSTLSGLILRTDGLDREFLDELASLHERLRAEVGLVSEIEATFDEIKSIWSDRFQFLKRNNKLPKGRRRPVQDRQDQSQMATFDLPKLLEVWGKLTRQVNPLKMTLEKTGEDLVRHRISRLADCEQWEAGGDDDSSLVASDDFSLAANDDSSHAANDDPEVPAALVRQQVQRAQLAGSCYGPEYWSNFTLEDWLPSSALPDRHPLTLIAEALHRPLSVRAGGQQWLIGEDGTATIKPGAIPKNSLNLTVDELADQLTP
ncbi:hypothetical protein ACTL6P_07240 [Endozoicomonas acroporae]|uniref:hypothetical protein n=1 Tax=Endozoicomonas acroporae TaxID=1701104 RepID=UPI000C77166B|nr:hypothetical protein [Endozoicomonas acroporae]